MRTPIQAVIIGVITALVSTAQAPIVIDYPADQSIFPPEITPPTFLWRDPSDETEWLIDITFGHGAALHLKSKGCGYFGTTVN
jgi:hypothetical protein